MPILNQIHRDLTVYKPNHSNEESNIDNSDNQLKSFQHIIDDHQVFNLIMILIHIFCQAQIALDPSLHSRLRKLLDSSEHIAYVKKFEAI